MATYYVSPTGNDANAGTSASPWLHFSHAAATAVAGDTVLFVNGTYGNEGQVDPNYVVTLTVSGTSSAPITFQSQNRGGAILDGGTTPTSDQGAQGYISPGSVSYVVLDGFVIQNTSDFGIHTTGTANNITVRHCEVRSIGNNPDTDATERAGIYFGATTSTITVDGCLVHGVGRTNASTGALDHGIYCGGSNSFVINCICYGQTQGWDIKLPAAANSVLVANNVLASHNPQQNGQILIAGTHAGLTIQNNIFYNPLGFAVSSSAAALSSSVFNTNLITNGAGAYSGSGLVIGTNQLNTDAKFTNPGAFDFTLLATSPAIDAGITIAAVPDDFLGVSRPQGTAYDIGAYEYAGGGTLPSITSFTASPTTVASGGAVTLSFAVTGASSLTIDQGVGPVTGLTSVVVNPTVTTTYKLTATNAQGSVSQTVSVFITISVPAITSLTASPASVAPGAASTISWNVIGATSLSIDQGVGPVTGLTSVAVNPTIATTYTLTATNAAGSSSRTVTVGIVAAFPVIASFTANPSSVTAGGSSTLSWVVTGALSLSINQSVGAVTGSSVVVNPVSITTTYTLTATNAAGSNTATVTVTVPGSVIPPPLALPVIASFTATPTAINAGQSSILVWSVSGADSVDVSTVPPNPVSVGSGVQGSSLVSPGVSTTYVLTATNAAGASTANVIVAVGVQGVRRLRRAVFGAPLPGQGVDHPTGSRFVFLGHPSQVMTGAGIMSIPIDPLWVGQNLFFKFIPFNSLGTPSGSLTDATAYQYTPIGTAAIQNPNSNNYVQTPQVALSMPNANTIVMSAVTEQFTSNTAPYNGRVFNLPNGLDQTYYITIGDPGYRGDVGTDNTTLVAYCEASQSKAGAPGYVYIGSVGPSPQGPVITAGGWPVQQGYLVNGT